MSRLRPGYRQRVAPRACSPEALESRRLLASVPLGPDFVVSEPADQQPGFPAAAVDGAGGYVVAWQAAGRDGDGLGVYARRFHAAGAPAGEPFRANTHTTGNQSRPSVGASPAGFVVAWQSELQNGSPLDICAQLYDASGAPVGYEFPVNTLIEDRQSNPAVAMGADGGFVVAWVDRRLAGVPSISARRFGPDGVPLGPQFTVSPAPDSAQTSPAVAVGPGGAFVIAWDGVLDGGLHVFARQFDSGGVPWGEAFPVTPRIGSDVHDPFVAAEADGGFVVAWQTTDPESPTGADVLARRYGPDGSERGETFPVNTRTAGHQSLPTVSAAGAGFVVTWHGEEQPGGARDVFARSFGADGAPTSDEIPVNATVQGDQFAPAVAAAAPGRFLVAWQGDGADGTAAVHARIFGAPVVPPPTVTAAFASGSAWTPTFTNALAAQIPDAAPLGCPLPIAPAQRAGLPWMNLDRVSVRVDGDADVRKEDLVVRGQVTGNYEVAGVEYDSATRTATWSLARALRSDRFELKLDVRAPGGAAPANPFVLQFHVVPGDVTRDGVVNATDAAEVRSRQATTAARPGGAAPAYSVFHDPDGSGTINVLDYAAVRARHGAALPAAPVAVPTALPPRARPPVRRLLFSDAPVLLE